MKLVTIQTKSAFEELLKKGYLVANANFINKKKYGIPYGYIVSHMQNIENKFGVEYPLWAWVKYGAFSCPPKNKLLNFFPKDSDEIVRITFEKDNKDVLVTDYIKYHFLLTNEYLPLSLEDKEYFDSFMARCNVSKEDLLAFIRRDKYESYRTDKTFCMVNKKIQESYIDIFNLDSKYLQGTVWNISKDEIRKVEIIRREVCTKKNPVDYRREYIKTLSQKKGR